MALRILIGPRQWDAANYVRQQIEDTSGIQISDDALRSYAEVVNEEFSRCMPQEFLVGDPINKTSPLVTKSNQQRYVLDPEHGFAIQPLFIKQVIYTAWGVDLQVMNDWAAVQMQAAGYSPLVQLSIDNPTHRLLRDYQIDEIRRYSRSYFDFVTDGETGLPALDMYPIPQVDNFPILVKYLGEHPFYTDPSTSDISVPSVSFAKARDWGKLLLIQALEELLGRYIRNKQVKAGLVERQADTKLMETRIERLREEVNGSLGYMTGTGWIVN